MCVCVHAHLDAHLDAHSDVTFLDHGHKRIVQSVSIEEMSSFQECPDLKRGSTVTTCSHYMHVNVITIHNHPNMCVSRVSSHRL